MDYEGVATRVKAFDARHGASVEDDQWVLFEDGARREVNPLGPLIDPSSDLQENARRILHYHSVRLQRAIARFERKKRELGALARAHLGERLCGSAPMDLKEAETLLSALRDTVMKCKQSRDAAQAEVEANKPQRLKELERQSNANRMANQEILTLTAKFQV